MYPDHDMSDNVECVLFFLTYLYFIMFKNQRMFSGWHTKRICNCFPFVPLKWGSCYHSMAHPQVISGGVNLQMWRVVADILNKQS
jgi:hypothetical protein